MLSSLAHPTLQALWPHLQRHALPISCLFDLLDAFEQDVRMTADQTGMRSWEEVLSYCQRSANPVGKLMLTLMGQTKPEQIQQSDAICTALQLINFWQDLSIDQPRGRHYLPPTLELSRAMTMTRALMIQGAPLAWQLSGRMGLELRAVVHGGLRVLELMAGIDVTQQRPQLSRWDWVVIATRSLAPFPPKV
jgi:phytoene/squalene synthetase